MSQLSRNDVEAVRWTTSSRYRYLDLLVERIPVPAHHEPDHDRHLGEEDADHGQHDRRRLAEPRGKELGKEHQDPGGREHHGRLAAQLQRAPVGPGDWLTAADQAQAPPDLRTALATITRQVNDYATGRAFPAPYRT
jgi:hypothetical protein